MAATLTRLIFFTSGDLHAIVNADNDGELEPHRAPLGGVFVDVPRDAYFTCGNLRDQLTLALPPLVQKDPGIAAIVSAKIEALDAAVAVILP